MKRLLILGVLAVIVPILGPVAPAQAAVQSWAHVWDRDQTTSKSGSSTFTFPYLAQCPQSFNVAVSWIKWTYSSPEGPSVRIKKLSLRLKPNHKLRVTIDGINRWYPAGEYTTRHYEIDTSQSFPLQQWDGGNAVGVGIGIEANTSTYYAPANTSVAGACKSPTHLAGLKRHF